jgi:uncharacterized protein YfdQ (DUF2303 family)
MEESKNVQALINLGATATGVRQNPHQGGRNFVMVPKADGSMEVLYLERPELPFRLSGIVEAHDVESFVLATNRYYSREGSVIYATLDPAAFTAVLNDNRGEGPSWRDHRVSFTLKHSKEYLAWTGKNRTPMSQEEFAYFIEDNMPDFSEPSGARMLEIAVNFRVKQGVHFSSAIRLNDGTVSMEYTEQNAAGATKTGKVSIPEKFKIDIPVWAGLDQKTYEFEALLRYKVSEGDLNIRYELQRPHKVVERAFEDTLDEIRSGIEGATVIFGKP